VGPLLNGVSDFVTVDTVRDKILHAFCPDFVWDRVDFLPSSCCVLDLV